MSGVCGCLEVLKGHIYNGSLYKNVRQVISRKKKNMNVSYFKGCEEEPSQERTVRKQGSMTQSVQ